MQRFSPYARPPKKGANCLDSGTRGKGVPGDRGGGGNHQGGGGSHQSSWYKVTIPHGGKYQKEWLLTALGNICSVPYAAVQYHLVRNRVHFFVSDSTTADALRKCSHRLTDTDGYKVVVRVNRSAPPLFLRSNLLPEDLEHLKQCMSKRFDASQQALDLNNIGTDPGLVSQNIRVILNKKTSVEAVIKIIEENIPTLTSLNLSNNRIHKLDGLGDLVTKAPNLKALDLSYNELKSQQELDKIKGLKLVELWLNENPLRDFFKDQPSYISAVRQRFPQLLKLDGNDLPPPTGSSVETPTSSTPQCQDSNISADDLKALIQRFLLHYYRVYDSGDRQPLLDAYYNGATFSLSVDQQDPKTRKDSTTPNRLSKHSRLNVVAFLKELPKTQHDVASFKVHVNSCTNTLLSFTVSGLFKAEAVDGESWEVPMAFSREFTAMPAANSGLCVVNDHLHIRMATTEENRRPCEAPALTSLHVTFTQLQQEMLTAFSLNSGMNLEWSRKCLQDNGWDFNRAAHVFTCLKTEGKIPDLAFIK